MKMLSMMWKTLKNLGPKEFFKYVIWEDGCGYIQEIKGNIIKFLVDMFCPHLKVARKFMKYALNRNGTKLLGYSPSGLGFRCRTRDENQYYYDFSCSLFGKVEGFRTQYIQKDRPVNLFVSMVVPAVMETAAGKEVDESEFDDIQEVREKVFEKRLLTQSQFFNAIHKVRRLPMDWF